jgi:hypothetical protein
MSTTTTTDIDRLYALWRLAVEKSLATGDRAAFREALRLFEAYTIARERAAKVRS